MQTVEEMEGAIIEEFKRLKKPGDVKIIAEKVGKSTQTIYNVLHRRKYSKELLEAMVEFYKERKVYLENSLNQLKSQQ